MSDESFMKALKESLSSEKSYANYVVRLNLIKSVCKKETLKEVLLNPATAYPLLKTRYPNPNSRKSMMVPLLSLFRLNPSLSEDSQKEWKRYFDECAALVETDAKKNKMKEKQKEKYVSTEEVDLKRLEMKKGDPHANKHSSLQYVLLTLLCDITPKRSDLGRLRVYFGDDPGSKDENYIVLRNAKSGLESYLVMNVYKTAKSFGRMEEELSNETIKVLKESLRRYPRNHVFVGRNGRPYESNNTYGKFVERTFLELFGKATGPSLWRHIFISEKVKADASEDKLEEIANLMLHGVNQQRRYRFADKEGKKACVCITKE